MITAPQFAAAAQVTNPGIVSVWAPVIAAAMQKYQIDTIARQAGFLANVTEECGQFTKFIENLNYSVQELADTWPARFSTTQSKPHVPNDLAKKTGRIDLSPQKCDQVALANLVYGRRFGNLAPNDGWTYRGRGPIELTFKSNYQVYGAAMGLDLINNPDLLLVPFHGADAAARFWKVHGCNEHMDVGDFLATVVAVNGDASDIHKRNINLNIALKALQPSA